jgi:hypothetical protein
MKDFNGIQSPFDQAIVPIPGTGPGAGARDTGGVDVRDGMKETSGQITSTNTVHVRDETPLKIAGS